MIKFNRNLERDKLYSGSNFFYRGSNLFYRGSNFSNNFILQTQIDFYKLTSILIF